MKRNFAASVTAWMTVFVCSCSATLPPKKAPEKAAVNLQQEYKAAKAAADAGNSKKAMVQLKKIVAASPESDVTDDAHYLMGNLHFAQNQYGEALNDYNAILNGATESPLEADANIRAVRTLLKLGRHDEAQKLLERASLLNGLSAEQSLELERLRYENASAQKKNLEALSALVVLSEKSPQAGERDKYRSLAQEIMDSRLSEEELREISSNEKYGFLRAPAKYRLALMFAEQKSYGKARDYLTEVAQLAPGTEIGEKASSLIQQIDSRNRVDAKTIGVILPLSGKQQATGYKALKGIQLGLGIYGRSPSNFRLSVIDSEGNPDVARRAVERLVTEDNVIAIIGGLLSRTVSAEATRAQEFGVPAIMLSQKAGVTQAGDFVFRNALTSQMQVQHLVDLAMNQLGYKNFAVMFPNDAYGIEFTNLFWDEVKARGGSITGAQPYDPKETDFRAHVQRLVGTFYLEDRATEYGLRLRAWQEKNPRRSSRQAPPAVEEILPPIVDFDAIFIPDSARAVGQIAPALAANDVNKTQLLGTNIWNGPAFLSRGQKYVENSIFVDGFLATDPSFQNSEFFQNFNSTFDEKPTLTEVQAYDSALVLRQLISSGENTRIGLQQRMASLQNFPGAIGALSVNNDREFRRPLTTLTVKEGRITSLNAPKP